MFSALLALGGIALVVGAAAVGVSMVHDRTTQHNQKVQQAQGYAKTNLDTLNSSYDSLNKALAELNAYQKEYDAAVENRQKDVDLLAIYNAALESKTGDMNADNEYLRNKYLLNQQKSQNESEKQLYEATSAEDQRQYVVDSFSSYAAMLKERSLNNVIAGATGAVQGAYTMKSLMQKNDIAEFVGSDMTFDYGDGSDGEGTFARIYAMNAAGIRLQVSAYETKANQIMSQIYQLDSDLRDKIEATGMKIENYDEVIKNFTEGDGTQAALKKKYEDAIRIAQQDAITALAEYKKNAAEGEISSDKIAEQEKKWKTLFKDLGYSIE